jgi:hypothetical protein
LGGVSLLSAVSNLSVDGRYDGGKILVIREK